MAEDNTKDNLKLNVNERIRASHVRLIDSDGKNIGIVTLEVALNKAKEDALDLVEISPDAQPPVCKILDYNRYNYELQKKLKGNRKRSKTVHLKQIRLSPNIGKNDLLMKFKKIKNFLELGHKVKVNMHFKGRQREHQEVGREIMNGIIRELSEIAETQSQPKFEGYYMSMLLVPAKEGK